MTVAALKVMGDLPRIGAEDPNQPRYAWSRSQYGNNYDSTSNQFIVTLGRFNDKCCRIGYKYTDKRAYKCQLERQNKCFFVNAVEDGKQVFGGKTVITRKRFCDHKDKRDDSETDNPKQIWN